jgi:hypothetical protein
VLQGLQQRELAGDAAAPVGGEPGVFETSIESRARSGAGPANAASTTATTTPHGSSRMIGGT